MITHTAAGALPRELRHQKFGRSVATQPPQLVSGLIVRELAGTWLRLSEGSNNQVTKSGPPSSLGVKCVPSLPLRLLLPNHESRRPTRLYSQLAKLLITGHSSYSYCATSIHISRIQHFRPSRTAGSGSLPASSHNSINSHTPANYHRHPRPSSAAYPTNDSGS